MEKMITFVKGIYAGFMIGLGGIVYLSVDNKIIGSMMFSFGLATIVVQGFNLFTGKIGFVKEWKEMPDMLIIIAGNYVGAYMAAILAGAANLNISSTELVQKKLDNDPLNILLLSVFCGALMFLAIDNYKKSKNIVFVIAPVMIFILSGFEHSVASMFYFHLAGAYSLKASLYIVIMLVGNGIGAQILSLRPE